jgi:hypothetical protein
MKLCSNNSLSGTSNEKNKLLDFSFNKIWANLYFVSVILLPRSPLCQSQTDIVCSWPSSTATRRFPPSCQQSKIQLRGFKTLPRSKKNFVGIGVINVTILKNTYSFGE